MFLGLPELIIMLALVLGLDAITVRWRPAPPPLLTRLLVMVLCLAALGVSQAFPGQRLLSVAFLFAAVATGVLSGIFRGSLLQREKR